MDATTAKPLTVKEVPQHNGVVKRMNQPFRESEVYALECWYGEAVLGLNNEHNLLLEKSRSPHMNQVHDTF